MDPLAELKQTFFQECDELLGALEQKLQALDEGSNDSEDVNAAFRAIHSIKGGAGAFGCTELVAFAHVFEASLDHLRSGRVAIEDAPFTLFLRCSDAVADLVAAARNDEPAVERPDLLAALEQVGQEPQVQAPVAAVAPEPAPAAASSAETDAPPGIAALGNLLAMVEAKTGVVSAKVDDGWDDDEPAALAPEPAVAKPGRDVRLRIAPEADLFRGLVRAVLAQLISSAAARSITGKVDQAVKGRMTPTTLGKLTEEQLQACGVSSGKRKTLQGVIEFFQPRGTAKKLLEADDDAFRETLLELHGIGPWTVDMVQIFCLGRPDVWPVGDLGVRAAVQNLFRLRKLPDATRMNKLAKPWKPYRSIAAWYLWRTRGQVPQST